MEILFIDNTASFETGTVATVGFFDGVHRGHLYLLQQVKDRARSAGLKTAVITFSVHPRKVLQQEYQPQLLNSFDERLQHLASAGIDYCCVIDFTKAFSEITAQNFIQQILYHRLNVKELIVGYDHKFGKGRADSYEQYAAFGEACGMVVLRAKELPEKDGHTSSTAIRRLLSEGKIREATAALSYRYALEGIVVHGNHLGRTIGFPTANIDPDDKEKLIPMEGVYAARVEVGGKQYYGMAYIGKRPTVTSAGEKRIEVNIFDFDKDIYGEQIRLEFLDFIRPDIHFSGLEELKGQLAQDKENVKRHCERSEAIRSLQ